MAYLCFLRFCSPLLSVTAIAPFVATLRRLCMLGLLGGLWVGVPNTTPCQTPAERAHQLYVEGNRLYDQTTDSTFAAAMRLYQAGLRLARPTNDSFAIGRGEYLVGAVYDAQMKPAEALAQYRKAYHLLVPLNKPEWAVRCNHALAITHRNLGHNDSTLFYITRATQVARQYGLVADEVRMTNRLAYALLYQPDPDTPAVRVLLGQMETLCRHPSLDSATAANLWAEVLDTRYNYHNTAQNHAEAAVVIRQLINNYGETTEKLHQTIRYDNLKRHLRALGQWQEALAVGDTIDSLRNLMHSSESRAALALLQDEFKAEQEAARAAAAEAEAHNANLLLGITATALAILGGLVVLLVRHNVARRRINDSLKRSEGDKTLLLQELHHRVKNNLQMLSTMLMMQANRLKHDPAARDIVLQSRSRVEAIATVHRNLDSRNFQAQVPLADFLSDLATALASSGNAPVSLNLQLSPVSAGQDVAVSLGILVNELITNSLKHAQTSPHGLELSLTLRPLPENGFEFTYTDNGPGLPFDFAGADGRHFGLRLIQLMAEQLHGTLHQTGTTWHLAAHPPALPTHL